MAPIIRTKDKAQGGITKREKSLMDAHAQLWISRAMRTAPIEPHEIIPAIEGLYAVAGRKKPRVIIVPSPLVMAFAYGSSAAIWYTRKHPRATHSATYSATGSATDSATGSATYSATRSATGSATHSATYSATYNATDSATGSATYSATRSATYSATHSATYIATGSATGSATYSATRSATGSATHSATYSATYNATDSATGSATGSATYSATHSATGSATRSATRSATGSATHSATHSATYNATDSATGSATYSATRIATGSATHSATDSATDSATGSATRSAEASAAQACFELAGEFGIECARRWQTNYQGGNMWAGYDCYLTACRDILGLELREHAGYAYWERAAIHGGFRVMHEEFCLVSDFPETIRVDDQNRPHCENGPSHRWRDGWSLYHWHGTRIPPEWIEERSALTPEIALAQANLELRRAACDIVGWEPILKKLGGKIIDRDGDPQIGELLEVDLPGSGSEKITARYLRVRCGTGRMFAVCVPPDTKTALDAQAWMIGLTKSEFVRPEVRT